MVTKEMIKSEIEKVPDDCLEELYSVVKDYAHPRQNGDERSLMSRLQSVAIEGPEDFSENIDLYLNGEKTIG